MKNSAILLFGRSLVLLVLGNKIFHVALCLGAFRNLHLHNLGKNAARASPDVSRDASDEIRGYLVWHILHLLVRPGVDLVLFLAVTALLCWYSKTRSFMLISAAPSLRPQRSRNNIARQLSATNPFRLITMWAQMHRRHENNTVYSSQPFWSESVPALSSLPC